MEAMYFHFCKRQGEDKSSGEKKKEGEMVKCLYTLIGNKTRIEYKMEIITKITKK